MFRVWEHYNGRISQITVSQSTMLYQARTDFISLVLEVKIT